MWVGSKFSFIKFVNRQVGIVGFYYYYYFLSAGSWWNIENNVESCGESRKPWKVYNTYRDNGRVNKTNEKLSGTDFSCTMLMQQNFLVFFSVFVSPCNFSLPIFLSCVRNLINDGISWQSVLGAAGTWHLVLAAVQVPFLQKVINQLGVMCWRCREQGNVACSN